MTERLYWEDPYATAFEATVVEVLEVEGSPAVVLDRTLFYPTAGGQPHDTGTLGGARVVRVLEAEKHGDTLIHVLDRPLAAGARVEGAIDWPRRYRHMQRHTAQHILSQAFLRAGRGNTLAVNLKNPVFTVDLDLPPDPKTIEEAEALANWAVYANLPVRTFFLEEAQVPLYPLRRMPQVRGRIRVVEIGDWDLAPCGGTHLRSSAEAGPIKVLGFERWKKGGTRVYATAGWEALEDYAQKHAALKNLAQKFASRPLEVPDRVAKLEVELYRARGARMEAERALAGWLQEALVREQGRRIAAQVPAAALEELARGLQARPGTAFLLVAPTPPTARFVLFGAPEVWPRLQALGARGGGRDRIQGVLPLAQIEEALQTFRDPGVDS